MKTPQVLLAAGNITKRGICFDSMLGGVSMTLSYVWQLGRPYRCYQPGYHTGRADNLEHQITRGDSKRDRRGPWS